MLSKAQKQVADFIISKNNNAFYPEVLSKFHKKTLDTMIKKGMMKVHTEDRLRADDREMVYQDYAKMLINN